MLVWLYGKEVEEIKITSETSTEGISDELREQIRTISTQKNRIMTEEAIIKQVIREECETRLWLLCPVYV